MKHRISKIDWQSISVFSLCVVAAVFACYWSANLAYLAPFIASAAVLANAGEQVKKVLVATAAVYLICIVVGSLGAYAFSVMSTLPLLSLSGLLFCTLCCVLGYVLCLVFSQQHPPALALLAVIFLHKPSFYNLIGLLGVVLALAAAVLMAVFIHRQHSTRKKIV